MQYTVKVTASALNIRKDEGTGFAVVGCIRDKGVYTIVEEKNGTGAAKCGRLKYGAGWICLIIPQSDKNNGAVKNRERKTTLH